VIMLIYEHAMYVNVSTTTSVAMCQCP